MLSTRRDLLPPHIANELALLQDRVAPFDTERAQHIIRQSLQVTSLDEVFSEFDTTPLASASIAQVHAAKLKDGDIDVVVKVLRPDIRKTIVADTELMMTLAKVLQKWLPDGKRLRPVEVVKEYEKTIVDELDLTREAANGMQLGRNLKARKPCTFRLFTVITAAQTCWSWSAFTASRFLISKRSLSRTPIYAFLLNVA